MEAWDMLHVDIVDMHFFLRKAAEKLGYELGFRHELLGVCLCFQERLGFS
jgi:hypothetical protein